MKKIYKKALFNLFDQQMAENFPKFVLIPALGKAHLHSDTRFYVEKFNEHDWLFVYLRPDPRSLHESFTIGVGWSNNGEIPDLPENGGTSFFKTEKFEMPSCMFFVVRDDQNCASWDFESCLNPLPHQAEGVTHSTEVVTAVVKPMVDHAMETLIRNGAPILHEKRSHLAGC